jgi:Protein of unknown function (DUF732)
MKRQLAVVAATVFLLLGLPAPAAWADTGDELTPDEAAFAADMAAIGETGNTLDVIRIGYAVCHALDVGASPSGIVASALRGDPNLSPAQAWVELRAARRDLCP